MGVCWQRFSLEAVLTTSALTTNAPGLELLLVGNTSVGKAHNFFDRHLCFQTIEDVLPPPVLHQVVALRTFSDQGSLSRKRDKSIDSPRQI